MPPVSAGNVAPGPGSRCISVGHKTPVPGRRSGASPGRRAVRLHQECRPRPHRPDRAPSALASSVETVAYSPDSVADYTLMLMLMAVRHAKSTLSRAPGRMTTGWTLCRGQGAPRHDRWGHRNRTHRPGGDRPAAGLWLPRPGPRPPCHHQRPTTWPLDELLAQSDVVTLHTPLTADTHHLLDRRRIEQMQPRRYRGQYRTRCAPRYRGPPLGPGRRPARRGGAWMSSRARKVSSTSTTRPGPVGHQPLLRLQQLPNVLITPHTAYYTDHALRDIGREHARQLPAFRRATHEAVEGGHPLRRSLRGTSGLGQICA